MTAIALCIGINNYPGTENDLAGCVNDANDWAAELKKRSFQVSTLIDQQATKAKMMSGIESALSKAVKGDVVVITYSGHGTWIADEDGDEEDGRDEALCPHDIATAGPLSDDELHDLFLERDRGVHVALISDSCHSGTVARFAPTPHRERRVRFMPPAAYVKSDQRLRELRLLEKAPAKGHSRGSVLLLAGCQDTEFSWDAHFNNRPNGAFTRVALDSLSKLPPKATYRDWHQAIRKQLPSAEYPQKPNLFATRTQRKWSVLS